MEEELGSGGGDGGLGVHGGEEKKEERAGKQAGFFYSLADLTVTPHARRPWRTKCRRRLGDYVR